MAVTSEQTGSRKQDLPWHRKPPAQCLAHSGEEADGSLGARSGGARSSPLRGSSRKQFAETVPLFSYLVQQTKPGGRLGDAFQDLCRLQEPNHSLAFGSNKFRFLALSASAEGLRAETVTLAPLRRPEGTRAARREGAGGVGEGKVRVTPRSSGHIGPSNEPSALGPCSMFPDLSPGDQEGQVPDPSRLTGKECARIIKEVRANGTYGFLHLNYQFREPLPPSNPVVFLQYVFVCVRAHFFTFKHISFFKA